MAPYLDSLRSEIFSHGTLTQLLRALLEAGLVSKERGVSRAPNIYWLLLPQQVKR
jgi:hypothetical protein